MIEAQLDKGRGPVATLIVQTGTLRVGDVVVVGSTFGKVKALENAAGKRVLEGRPRVGRGRSSASRTCPRRATSCASSATRRPPGPQVESRKNEQAARDGAGPGRATLEDLYRQIQAGQAKELRIILKADVSGSLGAITHALDQLGTDEVKINVLLEANGDITDNDIMLATASNAIVVGFNTSITETARRAAESEGVDVRLYDIIYKLTDDIDAALKGMLEPEIVEVVEGRAEVRQIFRVGKSTVIAGCYVTDGRIVRNGGARVWRGGKVVETDKIDSLRRFRDDVREVADELRVRHRPRRVQRPRRGRHHRVLHAARREAGSPADGAAPMSQRTDRVDELLRQEIGALLAKEIADPRIGFATITDVETSPDLGHAKVWVSVIGGKADRDETLRALQQAMGYVRHELGRRLRIRRIPELHVRLDDSAETATRVLYVLNELEAGTDPLEIAPFEESLPDPGPPTAPRGRHRRPGRRGRRRPPRRPHGGRRRDAASPRRGRAATAPKGRGGKPARASLVRQAVDRASRATATHDRPPSTSTPWRATPSPTRWSRACGRRARCSPSATRTPTRTPWARRSRVCRLVEAIGGRATAVFSDAPPAALRVHAGPRPHPRRSRSRPCLRPARAVRLRDGRARRRRRDPAPGAVPRRCRGSIIDHHASNDARGTADWVDPDAAATCEMVALLAIRLGVPLDAADGAMATALMAGIVMDTATFAHPNATPRTLAVSAALVDAGAPLSDLSRRLLPLEARCAAPAVRPRPGPPRRRRPTVS